MKLYKIFQQQISITLIKSQMQPIQPYYNNSQRLAWHQPPSRNQHPPNLNNYSQRNNNTQIRDIPNSNNQNRSQRNSILEFEGSRRKMDVLFYNSFKKAKKKYAYLSLFYLVKIAGLLVFIPIDIHHLKSSNTEIITFFIFSLIFNVAAIVHSIYQFFVAYGDSFINTIAILDLANTENHIVVQQLITNTNDLEQLERCVSPTIYDATNSLRLSERELAGAEMDKKQNIYANHIGQTKSLQHPIAGCIDRFIELSNVGIFVYGLITLITDPHNKQQLILGIIYLVFTSKSVWITILAIVLVALCPLICLAVCIAACCYHPNAQRAQRARKNRPEAIPATLDMIQKAGSNCSICYQQFKLNQLVIPLPCSQSHMFHQGCISAWLNLKTTCPICRHDLGDP